MSSFNANTIETDGDITKKVLSERLICFLTRKLIRQELSL